MTIRIPPVKMDYINVSLASGFGQYHSDTSTKNPRPLVTIRYSDIQELYSNPQCVDKRKAQWLTSYPANNSQSTGDTL